jgi:myo-inositol-1(or 4)-monophosphatase
VSYKSDRDTVTNIDEEIETGLRTLLKAEDPTAAFLGEEKGWSGEAGGSFWTIDPIDGTVNMTRGLPIFGVSIAYIEDGVPVVGVVHFFVWNITYWAEQGKGAFENGSRLSVSTVENLSKSVVGFGDFSVALDADEKNVRRLNLMKSLAKRVERVRMHGSAAFDLCMVAKGSLDASYTHSNQPWDVCAGVIIVREAGGSVTDYSGVDYRQHSLDVLATNGLLKDSMKDVISIDPPQI